MKYSLITLFFYLCTLLTLTPALADAQSLPQTTAERSGFDATSRYSEVMDFIYQLQRRSDNIRVETLAVSAEGNKVPLLVLGRPVPASPQALQQDERAVVYIQANIHAGEVEGKEAALMLARDILLDPDYDYLDHLVVLIAPIFNTDGNDKISSQNRSNQDGPRDGVGIRYNGLNQDLNRDGIKLESPEVTGLVQNVLNRWDPVFFFDAHTHNGSYHQATVTWVWGLNPNSDAPLRDYMENRLWPAIEQDMRQRHQAYLLPHGDFVDVGNPAAGWVPLPPQPRYLSNMVALRNRISVLNEQYPYADFKSRVEGAHQLMHSFLRYLQRHREEVVRLVREADSRIVANAGNTAAPEKFQFDFEARPIERRLSLRTFELEITDNGGPFPRVRPLTRKVTYEQVPFLGNYVGRQSVPLPRGYLISAADQQIIAKLQTHGISVEQLLEPVKLEVEAFVVSALKGAPRSSEGHYNSSLEGSYQTKEIEFAAGAYYVSRAQPLGHLVAYLLEPQSDDGLVYWNYFDRYLSYQWIPEPKEYPVYKLHRPARLVTETLF